MFAALSLLAALTAPAHADDHVSVEGILQTRPDAPDSLGLALGVRAGLGALVGAAEGRALGQGAWVGRGTLGLDVLGRSDTLDVTVGGFVGALGGLDGLETATPTLGLELGAGLHLGRVDLRVRHALGLTGPLSGRLTEDELRLGLRLGEEQRLSVFGQGLRLRAGEEPGAVQLGVGMGFAF